MTQAAKKTTAKELLVELEGLKTLNTVQAKTLVVNILKELA